jgi:aconitate hydratase
VIIDVFGRDDAIERNMAIEYERNGERYQFLRWGQTAFDDFKVVPPGTGIVHQVNIEHLARVVFDRDGVAYPDTCVGTDSHTTMVNGLGVLGWGVGGIEAEAAMLGQPVSMLIPRVVGFKLTGEIPTGATATDVVLTITEMLRRHGVVGKFVEFYGESVAKVPLANRATIGNMSPEFGSTCGIFPIDEVTCDYLRLTGRSEQQVALVEAYCKQQGLWHDPSREAVYSEYIELDLSTVVPSIAGPKRPQDRVEVSRAKESFRSALPAYTGDDDVVDGRPTKPTAVSIDGAEVDIDHGAVVIASITSCTNTSNPSVMIGAGLLAKKAVEKGLTRKPWVKTSMAPGSKVVTEYYEKAGLTPYLDKLGYNLVGYGCATCIGNSGPIIESVSAAVQAGDLAVVSVLSGNRNFEGRINPDVKMNYLASPPLVIAYALAGTMDFDFEADPLGTDSEGAPVYLRDIWPSPQEVEETIAAAITEDQFAKGYADVFAGDARWQSLPTPTGDTFEWDPDSTYVRKPPYFEGLMIRGTFANIRLRNQLLDGVEGGYTRDFTAGGEQCFIYDAAQNYAAEGIPLVVLAGKEYGSGSSRDWAAKGTALLGVKAAIAESYERIHRSNLIGMGVLPLQFPAGQNADSLGLDGTETFAITGVSALNDGVTPKTVSVVATKDDESSVEFDAVVRIDTPGEADYYRNGGILQYVLRSLVG